MKRAKKVLSLLLVVCMLFGMTGNVYAADTTQTTSETGSDDFYKIVHLDCGRKYFTVDWVKSLIDEMAKDGYTHLELAFGNDGLRFLLDDMSVTVGDTTYSSADVTAGVKAGNKAYYDAGTNEWTQSEMDAIIEYANGKGISIIPLLNTPGHMDAIIDAMECVGISSPAFAAGSYGTSARTVDLGNETAVAFTQALVQKYVTYFAGKGCKVFNLGTDEYANDILDGYSGMGFGYLQSKGKYGNFVTYVNELSAIVKGAGMTPMAFNDGIYYNSVTSSGTFDSDIMVSYWSGGWPSYTPATAKFLADKGHKLINTHGDFYYVLGKNDNFDSGSSYASNWDNKKFSGSELDEEPAGAMFCIWCDYPSAETEAQITSKVINTGILSAMSEKMGHEKTDVVEDVTVWNGEKNISVKGPGLTTLEVSKVDSPAYSKEGTTVVGYDITPYVGETAYSGNAIVTIAVPDEVKDLSKIKVYDVTNKEFVTAKITDGVITFTATHFSEYDVVGYEAETITPDKTITLEVGGTATETQTDVNNSGNVNKENLDESIATVEVTGVDGISGSVNYNKASITCNTLISEDSNSWVAATGYYYTPDGENHYPVYAMRSSSYRLSSGTTYSYTYGYSVDGGSSIIECGNQEYSLRVWESHKSVNIDVYTKSGAEATPASTTITFTGKTPGTTYVTVGETTYEIIVNYKTETVNATVGQPTTVTVSGTADTSKLDTSIATVNVSGNTMKVTGVAVGTTTVTVGDTIYTIKVTEIDLSTVEPLTVEYWITNRPVTADGATNGTIVASAEGVYSESGALFSKLVPTEGEQDNNSVTLWKGTRLASDNKQTEESGIDKTLSGDDFNYIRYWDGSWEYSADGNEWTNVASDDQIVAYYFQKTEITQEITTNVVDWGQSYAEWKEGTDNRWFWDGYVESGSKYVFLDFAVVYEDGTQNPSSFPVDNTWFYHFDGCSATNPRVLGRVSFTENDEYEIWKVTVQDGTSTGYSSASTFNPTYSGEEEVVWTEEMGGEPAIDSLTYTANRSGKLVKVYVRAKVTEDSLTVHYIDENAGNTEFYNYNIAVKKGTVFDSGFGLGTEENTLVNNTVENVKGVSQTVTADLSTMSEIGEQYRYSDYTCDKVERSEDGKEVYLYYSFNNTHSFVVDFGLPLHLEPSDLGIVGGGWTSATVVGAKYGTAEVSVGNGLDYTPTEVIDEVEILQLTLTGNSGSATHQIYIYPATTVYYEEGFAAMTGFTGGSKGTGTQKTEEVDNKVNNYGYDSQYESEYSSNQEGRSNGTQATSATIGDTAEFTFTGTGVDIYTNSTPETGKLFIQVKDPDEGYTIKIVQVETALKDGDPITDGDSVTTGQAVNGYNVPVASLDLKDYGTYTVVIKHMKSSNDVEKIAPVYLDGFRVYGTLKETQEENDPIKAIYKQDLEDNPTFIELRDKVLAGLDVDSAGETYKADSVYAKELAGNTLAQVYASASSTEGAVVLSTSEKYSSSTVVQDLLDNGPKNEIYLQPSQSLVFKVTTNREVQIGLKALNKETTYTINNGAGKTLNSSTDMFYSVLNKTDTASEQTITITNTGEGILSITKLKICDDPNATFEKLTEDDLTDAFVALGIIEKAPETGKDEDIKDEDNKKPETGKDENIKDEDNKKPETGKDENIKDEDNKKQEQDKIKEQIKQYKAKKVRVKNVKSTKKNTAKVEWRTISGSRGYQIQYSKKSNFKSAKRVTVVGSSKKTATLKKLSSKTRYYVRVRAYKTINGKKVYTSWSTRKSVKVK